MKVDGAVTQTLAYNSANQVTTAGNSHDAAGNATQVSGVAGTFSYNAAQQQTDADGHTYGYAGFDQIELLDAPDWQFVYGRTDQHGMPWLQSFTYSGYQSAVGYVERDGAGTPLGVQIDGTDHFYVTDGLGSVVAIVDVPGNVEASYTYDPYGVLLSADGFHAEHNPIRYTGGVQDSHETNFVKLGRRWYNPQQGRFTQQDSLSFIGDPARGNRYAYAACNPVNYTDPTGLATDNEYANECILGAVGGAATTAIGAAGLALVTGGVSLPGSIAAVGVAAIGGCIVGAGLQYLKNN
jgi:RHS repeat-associated protein